MEVYYMLTVNKYSKNIKDEFYLDNNCDVRRLKDGYQNRFKKDDLAKFFFTGTYWRIQVPKARTTISKHHIVWILSGNNLPDNMQIDHIDGDVHNNHISNLRLVDSQTNRRNTAKRNDNTSGITGIYWSNYHQHYVIRRTINGKRISRSRKTLPDAKLVLQELIDLGDGYTVRHGK